MNRTRSGARRLDQGVEETGGVGAAVVGADVVVGGRVGGAVVVVVVDVVVV